MFGLSSLFSKPQARIDNHQALLTSLLSMAWFVEAKDAYTGGHLWRVSRFAHLVAKEMGLSEKEQAMVSLGGFLHDLGKVGIPDAILQKRGPLTDAEFDVIRTHPLVGQRLLQSHPFASLVEEAVVGHHERPDGRGYPFGKRADEITLMARIVGACDAFDAMTSTRPYRSGMPVEKAISILIEGKGSQFDEKVVNALEVLDQNGELTHVVGHSDEGIPLQTCPMCGPIIVVSEHYHSGDEVFCPSCASGFHVERTNRQFVLQPNGVKANAAQLAPIADSFVLTRMADTIRPFLTA